MKIPKPIINPFIENIHAYNGMYHSEYTTNIRNIVYDWFNWNDDTKYFGYALPNEVIEKGRELIFSFDYPIVDKTYESELFGKINTKDLFETAFISKFITDEIGFESVAMFMMKLRGRLFEIIPNYNAEMALLMTMPINKFYGGYRLVEETHNTHNDTNITDNTNTNNSNTKTNSNGKNITGEFPVNEVNAYDNIESINYASMGNSTKNNSTTDVSSTGKLNGNFKNNGGFDTLHTVDKDEKVNINRLKELNGLINKVVEDTLKHCSSLFLGVY